NGFAFNRNIAPSVELTLMLESPSRFHGRRVVLPILSLRGARRCDVPHRLHRRRGRRIRGLVAPEGEGTREGGGAWRCRSITWQFTPGGDSATGACSAYRTLLAFDARRPCLPPIERSHRCQSRAFAQGRRNDRSSHAFLRW